ncbi:MAG TPA: ParA family protein [Marinilabiliales bacterium]|nr:ParA family protein [Marinilabiliales bacterium]HBO73862.1 ParA family protein [Marinilabiliales bacterium]HBX84479.1 ParA family protein [Marinilabiliales bacterium]HBY54468.1 ParA family protein [Marinilabiliales bacterium]HCC28907.1 ParA family protein [Marinilabiliales bacterium]
MAKIISVINNKGGTGKTTTVLNLGAALKQLKYKVLLIDLDGQSNLSRALHINEPKNHVGELLLGKCPFEACLTEAEGMDVLPSVSNLLDYEYLINNEPGREFLLREVLGKTNSFDYILIDCPPSMGTLSINSLVAAHHYIVPMQAENFAFIGLDRILQIAEKVKTRMNMDLELAGILFVKYQTRTKFGQAVISNIAQNNYLKNKLFNAYIRQDINLMEAPAFGQSVFEYAPASRGAFDYMNFAKEFVKRYGKKK